MFEIIENILFKSPEKKSNLGKTHWDGEKYGDEKTYASKCEFLYIRNKKVSIYVARLLFSIFGFFYEK